MSPIQQMLLGVGAVAEKTYVDDVFSTYVYEGTGASKTITNGIDLSASGGGLVWVKNRQAGWNHTWIDTVRGTNKAIYCDGTFAEVTHTTALTSFNNNGFTVGDSDYTNKDDDNQVAYTFKKQAGFFDCVKYSGNDGTAFNVSHSLGVKPGAVLIKGIDETSAWYWWSKGMATANKYLKFDEKGEIQTGTSYALGANLTSTTFEVPTGGQVNGSSDKEYIAYLWADGDESAAQIFGENGDKPIIKMGYYDGTGDTPLELDLGFQAQWLLIKRFDAGEAEHWFILDSMRGWGDEADNQTKFLKPDQSSGESQESTNFKTTPTPTGFRIEGGRSDYNGAGGDYIYMAIRNPDGYVGKEKTATELFAMDAGAGSSTIPNFDSGFIVDFALDRQINNTASWDTAARLIQGFYLATDTTGATGTWAPNNFDSNVGWNSHSGNDSNTQSWMWRNWKGFECQSYVGVSSNGTRAHNMNNTPEMIWVKNRDEADGWAVYHKDLGTYPQDKYLRLDTDSNVISSSQWYLPPTSTHWYTAIGGLNNVDGERYLAMLFASVSGISKVGTYSGSSSDVTLNLGFTPRFFLTKGKSGTNATYWTMWDSLRGITGGGSATPRMFLNDSQAETTTNDNVSTTSTGITIETGPYYQNASGYEYIYYAHA